MKATLAILIATASMAVASPVQRRKYVTEYDTEVVTAYVYPDGSPAPGPTSESSSVSAAMTIDHFKARPSSATAVTTSEVTTVTQAPTTEVVVVASTSESESPVYVEATSTQQEYYTTVSSSAWTSSTAWTSSSAWTSSAAYTTTYAAETSSTSSAAATTTTAASTSDSGDDVKDASLNSHNQHRSNHSAPALTWDSELASYAMTSAQNCVFEHDLTPGGGGYGQNIAMYASSTDMPDEATAISQAVTNMWYNGEVTLYPSYGVEPDMSDFESWGHFSQIVWKSADAVGCASYKCAAGTMASMESWFTVCNYSPAGNYDGEYAANVLAPLGLASVSVSV